MQSGVYTAGGRSFLLDDAYFDTLNRARPLARVAATPIQDANAAPRAANDVGLMHLLGKSYEAALLLEVLRRSGLPERFGRALDIGSGAAIQSRFFRACGLVGEAEAIDVYDGRVRCSEARFWALLAQSVALHSGYRVFGLLPSAVREALLPGLGRKLPVGRLQFGFAPDLRHYTFVPRPGRSLSRYTVGDVFQCEGQYDLITSFMALDYFDFDRIAAKAAALLRPGGVFAFLVSYWWYPVNNTLLYGRFPYLLQRLAPAEVLAYFREAHPDISQEGAALRLGYSDQRRLTVADYEECALKQGLHPVATLRLHPDHRSNDRSVFGPLAIHERPGSALEQVLADARRWKPGVTLADLMTSHVLMAFRKAA